MKYHIAAYLIYVLISTTGVGAHWVGFKSFDITPTPIKIPGDMFVSLDGSIAHHLQNQVDMDVLMEKELLGQFTTVPCKSDVGTW